MTYEEVVQAVRQLSLQERVAMIEVLARSIRFDLASSSGDTPLSERLYGVLRRDEAAPSDEELREDYVDYLVRKYA